MQPDCVCKAHFFSKNVPISDIDKGINDILSLQGIVPAKILNHDIKDRGKIECYEKGTIAQYEYENTVFYLMALSEFDENNNAQNTKEDLVQTIIKLIDYYDKKGNGFDIYLPLLGTGQSRTGVTREEYNEVLKKIERLNENF